MIELVHNQRQIHTLQAGVIAPGFSQAVSAIVALQPNITADRNDELPGLSSPDGFGKGVHLGVEEYKVLEVISNTRISYQVFFKRFSDALIDHHFMSFVAFLFVDPEAPFVASLVIQKMTNPQL